MKSIIEPMTAPAFPQRRILVVDDEPFVCDAVKMMLNFDGHVVETTHETAKAEAAEKAKEANEGKGKTKPKPKAKTEPHR